MKKFLLFTFIQASSVLYTSAQISQLHAEMGLRASVVKLDWNMVNHPGKTTYILLRSRDGKNWSPVVTDRILRKYAEDDIFDYEDKSFSAGKLFYILRIVDAADNTVAFSNMVSINTSSEIGKWVLYPNPVHEVLSLSFKGDGFIKGVINVAVQNASGKTVIKFRAASINRNLQIPVNNLPAGFYVVQVTVENEVMMNEKFIKE